MRNIFPVFEIVALLAIGSQAAIVFVFMAGGAGLGNAQERAVAVPHLDAEPFRWRNVIGGVTAITSKPGMFALQRVTRLAVIEAGGGGRPLDERKVLAVMLGVTLAAALARSGLQVVRSVQTTMRGEARGNLGVTLQAFQFAVAADLVTRGAVGGAFQSLMRAR